MRNPESSLAAAAHRLGGWAAAALMLFSLALASPASARDAKNSLPAPTALLDTGKAVPWWVAFKFNSANFPKCAGTAQRACIFGGEVQDYRLYSQQYIFVGSGDGTFRMGSDCLGDDTTDPLGSTFSQIYQSTGYFYVLWNDQFYGDPAINGCSGNSCGSPWGHSKGMVAWNDQGHGVALQVSTPSWPAAGSKAHPRKTDGNTLGCIKDDDVQVSQHFFALTLTPNDLKVLLKALANASVVTDTSNPQVVRNGGPADVQALVQALGTRSQSMAITNDVLSSGVRLISKPSKLHVPPWQLISATLGGVPLRTATWWAKPQIPSTHGGEPECWQPGLGTPGRVEIATTGTWDKVELGLTGGMGANYNHAKMGVSLDAARPLSIFGDMNQQGALSGKCESSQNGRGGLFYVVEDKALFHSMSALLKGATAPVQ